MTSNREYCFCTIALGYQYWQMAKSLAQDLEQYSPGTLLYIFTESPAAFDGHNNIVAFKYRQQSIQRCSNDRRLLLQRVLEDFPTAIHIDADTRIFQELPRDLAIRPGLTGTNKDLIQHISKNRPQNLEMIQTVAQKLEIPLQGTKWIGEALYMISRDGGKEQDFFRLWGKIARYVELRGMHGGDGNLMGLAATKVGWEIQSNSSLESLLEASRHYDASHSVKRTSWEQFQRRMAYHYRLNKARLVALSDINFYYR